MAKSTACPVCAAVIANVQGHLFDLSVDCPRCGSFSIQFQDTNPIAKASQFHDACKRWVGEEKIHLLSSWVREKTVYHKDFLLTNDHVKTLKNLTSPPFLEKANRLLAYLANKTPGIGEEFGKPNCLTQMVYTQGTLSMLVDDDGNCLDSELLSILGQCWLKNESEFLLFYNDYLTVKKGFIVNGKISASGWEFLEGLLPNRDSDTCFVAMKFQGFDELYESIKGAIERAGWRADRVDKEYHNENVTNRIISGIRKARFLAVEFTGNCEGVYYEAGFAKGLGIPVIHIVKKDEIGKVHFDTNQINHLTWATVDEVLDKLPDWIAATVGYGPHYLKE